jgi:hypothetical protein
MTDKTFSHIGVATYKGKTKFRWTMGKVEARIKTMQKGGFENIEFRELPGVMTKAAALKTDVAADLAARYGIKLADEAEAAEEQAA